MTKRELKLTVSARKRLRLRESRVLEIRETIDLLRKAEHLDKRRISNLFTRLKREEKELLRDMEKLEEQHEEARLLIKKLENEEDEKEIELMELRYLSECSWEDIMDILNISYRHVHRIHKRALEKLFDQEGNEK